MEKAGWIEEFHLQGYNALLATCFHSGFLVGLFFGPEDGGDMFFRNIS
jgi:hypothetical protein